MTSHLKEHLIRCETAMQSAKTILGQHEFPYDNRVWTVIGFISVLIEHQESILLLLAHDMPSSAAALFRPVIEGAFRALWINGPATDAQLKKFNEKDEIDLTFGEITKAVDAAYGLGDLLKTFKARHWEPLNSYTHGGMRQLGRRWVKHEVAKNFREEELYDIATVATTIVLSAIGFFLNTHGHVSSGDQILTLLATYGPVADGQKPATDQG